MNGDTAGFVSESLCQKMIICVKMDSAVMILKEVLVKCYELICRVRREEELLQQLKDERMRLSKTLDGMPHGTSVNSKLEALTVLIVDMERYLPELSDIMRQCVSEATDIISRLTNPNERIVLINRYVFGKQFNDIAREYHYSESRIYSLHRKALSKLQ